MQGKQKLQTQFLIPFFPANSLTAEKKKSVCTFPKNCAVVGAESSGR